MKASPRDIRFRPRRSTRQHGDVLVLTNDRDASIDLVWTDSAPNEQPYGTFAPLATPADMKGDFQKMKVTVLLLGRWRLARLPS